MSFFNMFRFLFIAAACLAVPASVLSYSTGAPTEICKSLEPNHGLPGQKTAPPYALSSGDFVKSGDKISLTLSGDTFLGFVIQARDANGNPIGEFNIVDSKTSQILDCNGPTTITHKKIEKSSPVNRVETIWVAPRNYKGQVTFVCTVAKDGATYWIQKVQKNVMVQ